MDRGRGKTSSQTILLQNGGRKWSGRREIPRFHDLQTLGIGTFAKSGEFNRKYANKIMRLRLLLQFIAVILIMTFIYFRKD